MYNRQLDLLNNVHLAIIFWNNSNEIPTLAKIQDIATSRRIIISDRNLSNPRTTSVRQVLPAGPINPPRFAKFTFDNPSALRASIKFKLSSIVLISWRLDDSSSSFRSPRTIFPTAYWKTDGRRDTVIDEIIRNTKHARSSRFVFNVYLDSPSVINRRAKAKRCVTQWKCYDLRTHDGRATCL